MARKVLFATLTRNETTKNRNSMKRVVVLSLSNLLLTFCLTASAEPSQADQRWLGEVQKMVAKGDNKVSTPSEERVSLLKAWGKEHGYSVKVTKTDAGFKIELTKQLAKN